MGGNGENTERTRGNAIKKDAEVLFSIGNYNIQIRDVVWLLAMVLCVFFMVLGILFSDSGTAGNTISIASTILSISLSFIAIIKSMIDSADSSRIYGKTESALHELDNLIKNVSVELERNHLQNEKIMQMLKSLLDSNNNLKTAEQEYYEDKENEENKQKYDERRNQFEKKLKELEQYLAKSI